MAKTLKQILDGVKSSKTKTKDILGNQPGVDYSPKAGDERKFADKHKIEVHADRVGNGDDVYNATNVKQDTTARHGHKSREDEKVYEELEIDENYFDDAPARDSFDSHGSTANFHAETARQHAIAALVHTKTKEHDKAKKHQAAAEAHQKADLAHAIAGYHHSTRHVSRHDSSITAHKASKEANKLSDDLYNVKHVKEEVELDEDLLNEGTEKTHALKLAKEAKKKGEMDTYYAHMATHHHISAHKLYQAAKDSTHPREVNAHLEQIGSHLRKHVIYNNMFRKLHNEETEVVEAATCNKTPAGKKCDIHGMKACTPGQVKEESESLDEAKSVTINSPGHRLHGKSGRVFHKHADGRVNVQVKHSSKKGDVTNLTLKPGQFKEEVEQVDELLVQNYVSGAKNKSAEVHKNMKEGTYTVRKMDGGKEVGSSEHDDSASAHAAAKKHLGESEEINEVSKETKKKYLDKAVDWHQKKFQEPLKPEHKTPTGKPKKSWVNSPERKKLEAKLQQRRGKIQKVSKELTGKTHYSEEVDRAKAHLRNEEVELEEKAAIAKSKQTVLVTAKGTKSAGGVMRIKKSDYDPKKHDLAEDEVAEGKWNYPKELTGKPKETSDMGTTNAARNKADRKSWRKMIKAKQHKELHGVKEETEIEERKMSDAEMNKREKIVKGMKKKLSDFRARYGSRAKDVMYATATKNAMKEDLAQPLLGSADAKKKKTQSSPVVTPNTLPNFNVDVNTGRNV